MQDDKHVNKTVVIPAQSALLSERLETVFNEIRRALSNQSLSPRLYL